MAEHFETKKYAKFLKYLYLILFIVAIYIFCKYMLAWFMPFILALLLAKALNPAIKWLMQKTKMRRIPAATLCILFAIGSFSLILYFIIARIAKEVILFIETIPNYLLQLPNLVEQFRSRLSEFLMVLPPTFHNVILETYDNLLGSIAISEEQIQAITSRATDFAFSLPNAFIFVVTTLVSIFLIAVDYEQITKFIVIQIPKKWRQQFYRTKTHLTDTVGKWLKAMAILMLITFIELAIGLFLMGVEYGIFVAFFIALVDALPILGIGTVLIPWAIFELLVGSQSRAISIIIMYGIINLIRNVIEPKIVGSQIGLPPIATLIAVYIGYKTLGLLGMFLFPILAILLLKFQEWGYIRLFKRPKDIE